MLQGPVSVVEREKSMLFLSQATPVVIITAGRQPIAGKAELRCLYHPG